MSTFLLYFQFFKDTPSGSVLIRAINTTPPIPETLSEEIFERFAGKSALGDVEPTRVFFTKTGQSVYRGKHSEVPLNISGSKLRELGVGMYDIVWLWQYKTLTSDPKDSEVTWSKKWIPFEQSMHRVYVTVSCPKAP
ncbi:MAG: hypothetical protein P8P74_18550 [Crocinitomicaceae bacterium]|nr:hypothetical protein [Crocinitomicaceae bacterium]